jgi:hypothetical protein
MMDGLAGVGLLAFLLGFFLGSMMLISIKKDNVEAGFMGFRAGFIGSWM